MEPGRFQLKVGGVMGFCDFPVRLGFVASWVNFCYNFGTVCVAHAHCTSFGFGTVCVRHKSIAHVNNFQVRNKSQKLS